MSWADKMEVVPRTASRNSNVSSKSGEPSPKNESADFNFTLYGAPAPLRRTRTIIHRTTRGRTMRTFSLVPGVSGGAAKLLAADTALDLGFVQHNDDEDMAHPYLPIDDSGSTTRSSTMCQLRQASDSSCDVAESEGSDDTSKTAECSSLDCSPDGGGIAADGESMRSCMSHSSTCTSWTTDEHSNKSEYGSESKHLDEYDNEMNGEWNNFWRNYNDPQERKQSLFLDNIDNAKENNRSDSSCSMSRLDCNKKKIPEKKSPQIQKVIMSTADAMEAATCARRLSEILSMAIRRSSLPSNTSRPLTNHDLIHLKTSTESGDIPSPPPLPEPEGTLPRSKSESQLVTVNISAIELQNQKLLLKPLNNDCIEVEIRSTDPGDVAQILKNVINQRRDVIMPSEDTSVCHSHRSDWSSLD